MNLFCFLVSLCFAASVFSVSHAQDQHPQKRDSFEIFRRLVKNEAAVKQIKPYTLISEEEAVRRLIQSGGSMQDVVDLSLEYQLADEKARRLIGPGFSPGFPHNRLHPKSYTHTRFNDFPIVLKVVTDGVSYVVDLFVQMMKAGKSIGHIIRSFNNITNADTLEWYKNLATFDSSKMMTTACATYEINACMELMSPAVFDTYRNTSQTLDSNGDPVAGLYNAYFGSHACTYPDAPKYDPVIVESCGSSGHLCNFYTEYPNSNVSKTWKNWVEQAKSDEPSLMKVRWEEEGITVKECNQVFYQNCSFDTSSESKLCDVSIEESLDKKHLTGEDKANNPTSTGKTFTVNPPLVSTRNTYTQLVYTSGPKKGAVYRQCDAKVIEMYERIKFQIHSTNYKSTSGCRSEIYRDPDVSENPSW